MIPSGPRFNEITLPVALVCGCNLWHNSNDHCHCHCIQLDNELKSFCFPFFPSKISWPHFTIGACPRALSLSGWGILRCRRIPLLTKNLAPMILIRSTRAPVECLQLTCATLFLVLASHFSHQRYTRIWALRILWKLCRHEYENVHSWVCQ